jgi:16S rRNA (cytosine967-C5)-methyltransferase
VPVVTARAAAAKILVRALEDGAFAAAALSSERTRNLDLDVRDRALVTELVFGTLRYHRGLVAVLQSQVKKLPDGLVLAHILLGMYQVAFLDRVPGFAAVNEAVQNIRTLRGAQVAGFANAVLRKFVRSLEQGRAEEIKRIARSSVPAWIYARLLGAVGEKSAQALTAAGPPSVTIAVKNAPEREVVLGALRTARPEAAFALSDRSSIGIVAEHAGDLSELAGYDEAWIVQELGSQLVALAAVPSREASGVTTAVNAPRILDACSGRGNKVHAMLAVAPTAVVHACDLHPAKLVNAARRGAVETLSVDWTKGSGGVQGEYDSVLIDAPCSGFGTLRRRPDILLRRKESDIAELQAIQRAILAQASKHVAVGGLLTYAVCSVLKEEAEDVVSTLSAEFAIEREIRLLPDTHGTDGYYLASFHRVR